MIGGQGIYGVPKPSYPTVQVLTAASGVYYRPVGVSYIRVRLVGGGGGGGGSTTIYNSGAYNGVGGGGTVFGPITGGGGAGGGTVGAFFGQGGTASVGLGATQIMVLSGAPGIASMFKGSATNTPDIMGGLGGSSGLGLYGIPGTTSGGTAGGAGVGYGAGGGGGAASGGTASVYTGGGGGGGGFADAWINNPAPYYVFTCGAGGGAGPAGTSGSAGGAGLPGAIIVEEYYK